MLRPSTASRRHRGIVCFFLMTLLASLVHGATSPDDANSDYFFACSGGEFEKVKSMVEKDPKLVHATTKDGEHCLHLCALSGNADIVKLLLEAGADADIRTTFEQGLRMHPLSWSTFYGRHEIVGLLLEYGADPNADFDLGPKDGNGKAEVGTVLDVVEQILLGTENDEEKERFIKTRNILVKNGAARYASLEPEL